MHELVKSDAALTGEIRDALGPEARDGLGWVLDQGFLLPTGATAHRRPEEARSELTPQEAQIASLARDGLSQPRDRRAAVHQSTNGGRRVRT